MRIFVLLTCLLSTIGCNLEHYSICKQIKPTETMHCLSTLRQMEGAVERGDALQHKLKYEKAESEYVEAISLTRQILGSNHPIYAMNLLSLSLAARTRGEILRPYILVEQARKILEQSFQVKPLELANKLMNISTYYANLGQTLETVSLLRRAIRIFTNSYGLRHPAVACAKVALATVYIRQGQTAQAESLLLNAIPILDNRMDRQTTANLMIAISKLAKIYSSVNEFSQQEEILSRGMQIFDNKNIMPVGLMTLMLEFYIDHGKFDKAQEYLEKLENRADIRKDRIYIDEFGGYSFNITLNYLWGRYYEHFGMLKKAEEHYRNSIGIFAALHGSRASRELLPVRTQIHDLGRVLFLQGQRSSAVQLFYVSALQREEVIRLSSHGRAENEFTAFLSEQTRLDGEIYSLLLPAQKDPAIVSLALALTFLHQGRAADVSADILSTIQSGISETDRAALVQLRELRSRYAELALRGPDREKAAAFQGNLQRLGERADFLEADLARRSLLSGVGRQFPRVDRIVGQVAARLPKDAALVNFVAYQPRAFGLPKSQQPKEYHYLAFIITPTGQTTAVDLGPAAPIDSKVSRLHTALATQSPDYEQESKALYRMILRPLETALAGRLHLIFCLDGQLHLIPFQVLHDGQHMLEDKVLISYVSSGRDLLSSAQTTSPSTSVVVFAEPDYGSVAPATQSAPRSLLVQLESNRAAMHTRRGRDFRINKLPDLPYTWAEAVEIKRLFPKALLRLGADATERALMDVVSPGVLHIATHGLFLEDESPIGLTRTGRGFAEEEDSDSGNPLLLSALALAGAAVPRRDLATDGSVAEDGVVTAMELSGMNLHGTQLVVLSACNSGRGVIKVGQGVYGLRRALLTAGAETLVTSLWKVSDEATSDLMEKFYSRLLRGEGRAAAMREAALALRKQYPHPFYWASFIVIGSDAPLRGFSSQN